MTGHDLCRPLSIDGAVHWHASLSAAARVASLDLDHLPLSLRLLAINLLDNVIDAKSAIDDLTSIAAREGTVDFRPRRVIHQDYTGTAVLADLAALRDAVRDAGGDPKLVNPVTRTDLVVDHSLRVDVAGSADAADRNLELELRRNGERYRFLGWAAEAFAHLRVIPPGVGIVHQVNLEFLADVVEITDRLRLDSTVGTDSHTTMVNALCVLGWGVGGIEAEAAMLGQALPVTLPSTVAVRLHGAMSPGVTAMDIALRMAELLRAEAPMGSFVEFRGPGVTALALPDRATIANMAPEYGVTTALFPIDESTLAFLRATGRTSTHVAAVEGFARNEGLWGPDHRLSDHDLTLDFDVSRTQQTVSGPSLPHQVRDLREVAAASGINRSREPAGGVQDGAVAIAAITSCANTSNPTALIQAGLLARRAVTLGLQVPRWVKTSFTPGSPVVPTYLARLGLLEALEALGFGVAGFGCGTCAGGSGDLNIDAAEAPPEVRLAAVLSGNRNYQGRIHPRCELGFLASPALVVAYALAGSVQEDLETLTFIAPDGSAVALADLWPDEQEVARSATMALEPAEVSAAYRSTVSGPPDWRRMSASNERQPCFPWEAESTWLRRPPFLDPRPPGGPIHEAAVLLHLGDDVTTDHISPAGAIPPPSPAGQWLASRGVEDHELGTYGARRANHEVMVRGTFANPHLVNLLCPHAVGGRTVDASSGEEVTVHEAAARYLERQRPVVVVAGHRYGAGSSRDWAAKGPALLGVRAVIARSFERIHRSNLAWLGVLPIEVDELPPVDRTTSITIDELPTTPSGKVLLEFRRGSDERTTVGRVRLDNSREMAAYDAGGLLRLTLADLLQDLNG